MKRKTGNLPSNKTAVHFTANYLISPPNPVTVHVIGAGGTGSRVITELAEMNNALIALGHPGLQVTLFDNDIVSEANLVRQRFAEAELGMHKATARINNINRWFGTNWKAVTKMYNAQNLFRFAHPSANIFITCVDKVSARFEIAGIIKKLFSENEYQQSKPYYWIDFGNGKDTGQAILSTVSKIPQPKSEKFITVPYLPTIIEEYGDLLKQSEIDDDTPSCSAEEALNKQDLYINPSIAKMGCSLLYRLFRNGMTENKGFFLNLNTFIMQPLKVA